MECSSWIALPLTEAGQVQPSKSGAALEQMNKELEAANQRKREWPTVLQRLRKAAQEIADAINQEGATNQLWSYTLDVAKRRTAADGADALVVSVAVLLVDGTAVTDASAHMMLFPEPNGMVGFVMVPSSPEAPTVVRRSAGAPVEPGGRVRERFAPATISTDVLRRLIDDFMSFALRTHWAAPHPTDS